MDEKLIVEYKKLNKVVEKKSGSAIINASAKREVDEMAFIKHLGEIDTSLLEKAFGRIQTREIIVTNERLDHIKKRHPEDYNLFQKYGECSVQEPDIVVKDGKHEETVFMVKKLPDTNLNVVVRVVLETDETGLKIQL